MSTQTQFVWQNFQRSCNIVLWVIGLKVTTTFVTAPLGFRDTPPFLGVAIFNSNKWLQVTIFKWQSSFKHSSRSLGLKSKFNHLKIRFALDTLKANWPRPGYRDQEVPKKTGPTFFTSMFVSFMSCNHVMSCACAGTLQWLQYKYDSSRLSRIEIRKIYCLSGNLK